MNILKIKQTDLSDGKRKTWIDVIRGTSIALVILTHALLFSGLRDFEASDAILRIFQRIDQGASPFRMEIMFLISGMFVERSLAKGRKRYFRQKVSSILYPFLIWSLLIFLLKQIKSLVNYATVDFNYLVRIAAGSADLTWFLYSLFIFYLVTPFLKKVHPILIITTCILLALSIDGKILSSKLILKDYIPNVFYYFTYFYIGHLINEKRFDVSFNGNWKIIGISNAILLSTVCFSSVYAISSTWPGYLPFVVLSFPALYWISQLIGKYTLAKPLIYMGKNSIIFYLTHFVTQNVLSYVALAWGKNNLFLFIFLFLSGFIIPYAISIAINTKKFSFLRILFTLNSGLFAQKKQDIVI
jgi:uncharacterized membrane protein YcfT